MRPSLTLVAVVAGVLAAAPAPRGPPPPPVRILLGVDRPEVTPGGAVRLTDSVPTADRPVVLKRRYTVERYGRYDKRADGLINLAAAIYYRESGVFEGLPHAVIESDSTPRALEGEAAGRVGYRHDLTARRVGVFLVTAEWEVRVGERSERWASPPVVVTVPPERNGNGRAVLTDDLLRENRVE